MSYGIIRIQKMTSGSVKGIEIHDRREKSGISHTNKDIDWSRTCNNYELTGQSDLTFGQLVKKRISELQLKKAVRKDAIVMAQALVTSDSTFFDNLPPEQQKDFFQKSYDFLSERYGKENIISATVHLDEKTPHMHFNFVPVTSELRLSAKTLFTPITLKNLQTEFFNQVGKVFGLERGLEDSKERHLPVVEYKLSKASEKLSEAILEDNRIKSQLEPLKAEYEAKKAYIAECDKLCEISTSIPNYAKVTKFLGKENITVPLDLWEKKHVSANEKICLKSATEKFEKAVTNFKKTAAAENIAQLTKNNQELRSENSKLRLENKELKTKNLELKNKIEALFKSLPENLQKDFLKLWTGKDFRR